MQKKKLLRNNEFIEDSVYQKLRFPSIKSNLPVEGEFFPIFEKRKRNPIKLK